MLDSTETLDTFRLVRIDTISKKVYEGVQASSLISDQKRLLALLDVYNKQISLSVDQIRLYRVIQSPELAEIERKKMMETKAKTDQIGTEIDTLLKIINGLMLTSKLVDSLKAVGYQASCLYQVRKSDKSVQRDTASIILNLNMDIVQYYDFLKVPYHVDFDKFGNS